MNAFHDKFSLKGKAAVVTGGAGILGQKFCAGLAEFGASVAVIDIDEARAATQAEQLASQYGVKAIGIGCDIADGEQVAEMTHKVVEAFGGVDILHNNAATKSSDLAAFFAPFEEFSLAAWREVMSVNLDGGFLVSQAIGRQMIAQKRGGSIINTSSIYGIMGADKRIYEGSHYLGREINTPAVYAASKAGLLGLTRYLATHWAEHGIRVNAITPGGVSSGQNGEFQNRYAARVPMGRMAEGDEMVSALVYLASDASSYVTGQNIVVDGGLSAW
jgi:NAD(P)-dependent dehydrogenase (short-subunit alcohol dehydrogenase family)